MKKTLSHSVLEWVYIQENQNMTSIIDLIVGVQLFAVFTFFLYSLMLLPFSLLPCVACVLLPLSLRQDGENEWAEGVVHVTCLPHMCFQALQLNTIWWTNEWSIRQAEIGGGGCQSNPFIHSHTVLGVTTGAWAAFSVLTVWALKTI